MKSAQVKAPLQKFAGCKELLFIINTLIFIYLGIDVSEYSVKYPYIVERQNLTYIMLWAPHLFPLY